MCVHVHVVVVVVVDNTKRQVLSLFPRLAKGMWRGSVERGVKARFHTRDLRTESKVESAQIRYLHEIFTTQYKSPTTHSTHTAMLSPLPHFSSRLGERSNCTKEPAAGREIAVPATVASKAPTSCWHTCPPTTCSRGDAPAPTAGSRDAVAARCPARDHAQGSAPATPRGFSGGSAPARATAARHCRQRRSVAFARSRPVRRAVAGAPLSRIACGSSTYHADVLDERSAAGARA